MAEFGGGGGGKGKWCKLVPTWCVGHGGVVHDNIVGREGRPYLWNW